MKGHEALELLSIGLAVLGIALSIVAIRQVKAQAPIATTVISPPAQSRATALEGGVPVVTGLASPSEASEQARA